jgi:hypothetical protein
MKLTDGQRDTSPNHNGKQKKNSQVTDGKTVCCSNSGMPGANPRLLLDPLSSTQTTRKFQEKR